MPYDTRSPSSFSNSVIIGAEDWLNMNNISYEDTVVSQCTMNGSGSNYLVCTGFNFAIPQLSTITGVIAKIKKYANLSAGGHGGGRIEDSVLKLVKGGSISGTNLISTGIPYEGYWRTGLTYFTYGSSTNLWGLTLTPGDINSSNFGIAFSVIGNLEDGTEKAYIDHIELIVYYTEGDNSMSTDVVKKVINSNSIKNGTAVATTSVKGEYDTVDPKINKEPSVDAMNTKYANKFDDPTYYG